MQPEAVALAQHNARKLKIDNVRFLQGSWFAPVAGQRFALIASNPPYIDAADPHLSQGDVRFEPGSALVAADHGLAGESVRTLLQAAGFSAVATHRDYGDNDRVTLGQWPG